MKEDDWVEIIAPQIETHMMRSACRKPVCRVGSCSVPSCRRTSASVWENKLYLKLEIYFNGLNELNGMDPDADNSQ